MNIDGYLWRHVCQCNTTLAYVISSKSVHQLWVYNHLLSSMFTSTACFYSANSVSYHQWGCVCNSSGDCLVFLPSCGVRVQPAGQHWWSLGISGLPAWTSSLQPDRTASAGPGQCDGLLDHLENSRGRDNNKTQNMNIRVVQPPPCMYIRSSWWSVVRQSIRTRSECNQQLKLQYKTTIAVLWVE